MAKNAELTKMARDLYAASFKAYRYQNYSEDEAHRTAINLVNNLIGADVLSIAEAISLKVVTEAGRSKVTAPTPTPPTVIEIRESMEKLGRALGFNEFECQTLAGPEVEVKESGNETDKAKLAQSQPSSESQLQEIINRLVG